MLNTKSFNSCLKYTKLNSDSYRFSDHDIQWDKENSNWAIGDLVYTCYGAGEVVSLCENGIDVRVRLHQQPQFEGHKVEVDIAFDSIEKIEKI